MNLARWYPAWSLILSIPDLNNRNDISLYPLKFEPIYQYRNWGGKRLGDLFSVPLADDGPIGEAWLLSDREEHNSVIANGPLRGLTLRQLLKQMPEQVMGVLAGCFLRFPLLLKFLDVQTALSVQVHPSDAEKTFIPAGESGKTEAWVVLNAGPKSRIYAGLKPATTARTLRQALRNGTVEDQLASFIPKPGDGIFIPAGTVHSLNDVVVFEVQENSDVTFRLFDWNHVDPKTDRPRPLQIEEALACIDFAQGAIGAIITTPEANCPAQRERLFACEFFELSRLHADSPFSIGVPAMPGVLVALSGHGQLAHAGAFYLFRPGDTFLIPSMVGECLCRPQGAVTVLEISIPKRKSSS